MSQEQSESAVAGTSGEEACAAAGAAKRAVPESAPTRSATPENAPARSVAPENVSARRPPFVLLHGFAQTPASWNDVATRLREMGHEVFALDLLQGNGGSGEAEAAVTPGASLPATCDHLARTVRRIAQVAGLPVLVGYSMGGRIAAETVVRHARSGELPLAGLVLESAGLGPADEDARAQFATRNAAWADRLRQEGVEAFMDWWETLPLFASQRALPAETRAAIRAERLAHDAETLARTFEVWGAQHQTGEAETLTALQAISAAGTPVIYLAGQLDSKYAAVAQRVRNAGLATAIIPGAGHNVHAETPAAFVGQLVGIAGRC